MVEKSLAWLGSSLDDVRAFPAEARRDAGYTNWGGSSKALCPMIGNR